MPHRALSRTVLAVVLAALAGPAAADALGRPRVEVFSTVDRAAVEAGGVLEFRIEVLAAPASAAERDALVEAFEGLDVEGQLGGGFEVVRSARSRAPVAEGVEQLTRNLTLRVLGPTVRAVPSVRLEVAAGGRTDVYTTRPHPLLIYPADAPAAPVARSVVPVTAEGHVDGVGFQRVGSAFFVGDDALVTAYHVVVGARRVRVLLPDGREVGLSRAWALDPTRDVAVLYLDAAIARQVGLRPLVIAPATAGGTTAFTAGWPDRQQASTAAPRFDDLVLDAQRLRLSGNDVRPGDSGGPLLDAQGRVLGVVVSGRSTGGALDLLSDSICLAADPNPALARYRHADRPVRLQAALAHAAAELPAARAHEAAGAIQVRTRAPRLDRRPHVAALLDALRQAPGDAVLHYLAGTALEEVGEDRLAAGALDASRRAGYAPAGYSLAHHLLRQGHFGAALEVFGDVSESRAYRHLGAFGRAQALVGLGRYDEAEGPLEIVLDHEPTFAPALYLLGLVRLAQGREAEARALVVRLASRPAWAAALSVPVQAPGLRPPALQPLPRVAVAW